MLDDTNIIKDLQPDLQKIINGIYSMCELDFKIVEGKVSKERESYLWYKGEVQQRQYARIYGAAVTAVVYIDNIPCFSKDIYQELADGFRYSAQNSGMGIYWGGAINSSGFVDISKDGRLIQDIYEECYNSLINTGKEFNPSLQYFQLAEE